MVGVTYNSQYHSLKIYSKHAYFIYIRFIKLDNF